MKQAQAGAVTTTVILAIIAGLFVAAVVGYGAWVMQQQRIDELQQELSDIQAGVDDNGEAPPRDEVQVATYESEGGVEIEIYEISIPDREVITATPAIIVGKVPGSWSFEASFPIEIIDSEGTTVAEGPAQLLGDWMTDQLVVFMASLEFSQAPARGEGQVILRHSNASGEPERDDEVRVPVTL